MCELLYDVDAVIKFAAYNLLAELAHPGCSPGCDRKTGVTAATKYVASRQLKRRAADPAEALGRLDAFLSKAAVLEPTFAELTLAADLEAGATRLGVALDVGESQLCAMAIVRSVPAILTGDKRAVAAAESLLEVAPQLKILAQRVACLEQAMWLAVERLGAIDVRSRVVAEKEMDKAVSICFQFTNPAVAESFAPTGLTSYIESIRSTAPRLLLAGEALAVPSVS